MLLFVILLFCSENGGRQWQWPINPRHGISATFGEYRGARFHMGLDFSTAGREGMEIRPAASGSVFRVRAQERGYGRAVYVKHPNGWITVYAHLARFGPILSRSIESKGVDPLDLFGTLTLDTKIDQADLLAFSGESGAGLPHFHFEVRDGNNAPHDPLSLDFPKLNLSEEIRMGAVSIVPLDASSRVNHGQVPVIVNDLSQSIQAKGAIAIAIDAAIRDARGNTLSPRQIEISSDGTTIASWSPRIISYAQYRSAGAVFDLARSGFGSTRYIYAFDGRHQSFDPISGLTSEQLTIARRTDIHVRVHGFEKTRDVHLILDPTAGQLELEPALRCAGVQATSLRLFPSSDSVIAVSDTQGRLQTATKLLGLAAGDPVQIRLQEPVESWTWHTDSGSLSRTIARVPRSKGETIKLGPWSIERDSDAPNESQLAILLPANQKVQDGVLQYASPVVQFSKPGVVVTNLFVRFDDPHDSRLGIYAWSETREHWTFWEPVKKGRDLKVKVDYTVPLVAAHDLSSPTLDQVRTHDYFNGARNVVAVKDRGSGVDWERVKLIQGDTAHKPACDRDRGWIILPKGLRSGFTLIAFDRSDNRSQRKY